MVGGSLGAVAINQLVPQALARMPEESRPKVYHQTGKSIWRQRLQLMNKLE